MTCGRRASANFVLPRPESPCINIQKHDFSGSWRGRQNNNSKEPILRRSSPPNYLRFPAARWSPRSWWQPTGYVVGVGCALLLGTAKLQLQKGEWSIAGINDKTMAFFGRQSRQKKRTTTSTGATELRPLSTTLLLRFSQPLDDIRKSIPYCEYIIL